MPEGAPSEDVPIAVNLSSNDYLGLSRHPALKRAAVKAITQFGVGSGAGRPAAQSVELHERLEERLAAFKRVPAALTLQSGFAAVMTAIASTCEPQDLVISDEMNHPSTADGVRLAGSEHWTYTHCDVDRLEHLLSRARGNGRRYGHIVVATDAVFGTDGEIAPLVKICDLAERYGATVMVDEAHALGVLGEGGRGAVDQYGLASRVHIQVGTLSKAIGALGGYIAGDRSLREGLLLNSKQVRYSTLQSPPVVAACIAAIDLLEREPARVTRLQKIATSFRERLRRFGFDTGASETAITPIYLGVADRALLFSSRLRAHGVLAAPIMPPSVPVGTARLRTIVSSEHTEQQLDLALGAIESVGRELGVI